MKNILLLILLAFYGYVASQPVLVMGSTGQPPLNTIKHDGFLDEVVKEMLKRTGYQLEIKQLPTERSIYNVNNGIIDGDMNRIKGLEMIYKNIIRVPEKVKQAKFTVFAKKPINLELGWQSLANKKIAYMRGWKILDINVPKTAIITKTNNAQQMFKLLEKNRVELIIYDEIRGNALLDELNFKTIQLQQPALATEDMFIYLNKKHKNLITKLSQALQDMKSDGSYLSLVVKHFGKPSTLIH